VEYRISEFPSPISLFSKLEKEERVIALLESVSGPQYKARYSVVAWGGRELSMYDDPAKEISNILPSTKLKNIPGLFKGGLIGYVSYDAIKFWEKTRADNLPESERWPYAEFFEPINVVVYDHETGKVYVEGDLPPAGRMENNLKVKYLDESMSQTKYEEGVKSILQQIREGYAFQVVLSRFYRYTFQGSLLNFYVKLREINPSPYMFYIKFGDRGLVGSSPELLFRLQNGIIETYPIAGTRPRGKDPDEDFSLEKELLASEKERAEHLMLVDLARNDIGKVSVPGTVKVPELMYVEKYSHVQHMVSKVVGTLGKRYHAHDILRATFPAGTVSGAPKPMAMDIIASLEEYKRGPYAGAVGFFSVDGSSEFAINIRTAFFNNGLIRIQAGAGIVYDSQPKMEFKETEYKMMALKKIIGEFT